MSTDHRPSVDQLLTDTSLNEKLYRPRHIWKDYRPCLDQVSTDYRPTINRYVDRLSTECQPSIDRVSTDCRPTIDQVSTEYRPTVDRVSTAISTAISTDVSVDLTHSKQDPSSLLNVPEIMSLWWMSHFLKRSKMYLHKIKSLFYLYYNTDPKKWTRIQCTCISEELSQEYAWDRIWVTLIMKCYREHSLITCIKKVNTYMLHTVLCISKKKKQRNRNKNRISKLPNFLGDRKVKKVPHTP